MRLFIFTADVSGTCSVLVKAENIEEARKKIHDGDFTTEGEEWDAVVEDTDCYEEHADGQS